MYTVIFKVEKTSTGYSAYCKEYSILATGETLELVEQDAIEALNFQCAYREVNRADYEHEMTFDDSINSEEAMPNMAENAADQYEAKKIDANGEYVHPISIIVMAAKELGWQILLNSELDDDEDGNVIGLVIGTDKYMKSIFPDNDIVV